MAPSDAIPVETAHEDMIHDAQLDYYGKRLATCSSDRTIKVFDLDATSSTNAQSHNKSNGVTLTGHTGPVWQVAWAHPKYGSILASCSYDGKVLIWKEAAGASSNAPGAKGEKTWTTIKEHNLHSASVNSVSWAPHELGAIVACASSDGRISVLTFKNDGTWDASLFTAHAIGCNAVSWSPSVVPGSLIVPPSSTTGPPKGGPTAPNNQQLNTSSASQQVMKRFASAGCDNLVKIWGYRQETQGWVEEEVLDGHTDWVRDVAWAPNIGLPRSYIASASQDKTVIIWTKDGPTSPWVKTPLLSPSPGSSEPARFPEVVWRVSWSLAGNILAVSCADGKVTLYKENLKGTWECVSEMTG